MKWSNFNTVLKHQVTPILDQTQANQVLNESDYMNAPTIGHFSIYVQGDTNYEANYEPPAGAKIIKQNNINLSLQKNRNKQNCLLRFFTNCYILLDNGL